MRIPLLDLDLVDFAARVPVDWKQRGLTPKWILKEGHIDGSYTLFSMMCVELWCRQFMDSTSPRIVNNQPIPEAAIR